MATRLHIAASGLVTQNDALSRDLGFGFTTSVVVYVEGTGTISAGQVLIEEASATTFGGTWSVVDTLDAAEITGGKCVAVHINGVVGAIRARVSTTLTGGGTVAVTIGGA